MYTILTALNVYGYPRKAHNMLLTLQGQNYVTWACKVRNVLYKVSFVWEMQCVGNVKSFITDFKQRLVDCFKQDWQASLESHDFLS